MRWFWPLLAGCSFRVSPVEVSFTDDLAVPDLAAPAIDMSEVEAAPSPEPDLFEEPDLADLSGGCQPSCNGTSFQPCGAGPVSCALGCSTVGGAHCKAFYPSGGAVVLSDVGPAGAMAATFGGSVLMHTDTGQIEGGFTRAAGIGLVGGIYFRVANGIGIFSFASLTVGPGVILSFTGGNGVALVSASTITLDGVVDGLGDCMNGNPGPGGGAGGMPGQAGAGAGGGGGGKASNDHAAGAAGAGFADHGGSGGNSPGGMNGPSGGPAYTSAVLVGGSGGGGGVLGNNVTATQSPPRGGGGGGAVQLFAHTSITIGAAGGVNAGGCGGGATVSNLSGAGGGSGGMILVEAQTITSGGVLAANGGAGSGGDGSGAGNPGAFSNQPALGQGSGGSGGSAATQLSGINGMNGQYAGGGGGACGRIFLKNSSGSGGSFGTLSPSASPTPIDVH